MDKKNITKSIFLFLTSIFLTYSPVSAISVPEGIKGFTVTYGTWIESVLSKSILKDILFPEDQEQYDKLQRLIITSERLSEEGNHKEAISYLRRAEFFIEDIEKNLGHKYGWTKKNYTSEEMKSWSENARESWAMLSYQRISIYIQYEYFYILNNSPDIKYFDYILTAEKLYNEISKDTRLYNKLQNTSLSNYLNKVESSWNISIQHQENFTIDKMMEYLSNYTGEFLSGSGYWNRKYTKRSAILFAKYGYPEKAMYLLNHLMEDKTDTLPVEVIVNIMVYNGKFNEAEKYLQDNINTLNISSVDKWGIYIKYKNKLLSMLLLLHKYQEYDIEVDKYISQLEIFTQRIDLSVDIYEYILYQLNNTVLNKKIASILASGEKENNKSKVSIHISEFTSNDIVDKNQILDSYFDNKLDISSGSVFLLFRQFQLSIKSNELQLAQTHLDNIKKNFPHHYLTNLANLQYQLATNHNGSSKEWYNTWLKSIFNFIENPPDLIALNSGIFIDFNLETEFLAFISKHPETFSVKDLGNLLYAMSIIDTWNSRIISPPDYYRPVDFRLMYKYFSQWEFKLSDEIADKNLLSMIFLDQIEKQSFCPSEKNCWLLYPVKDRIYSFAAQKDTVTYTEINQKTTLLMNQVRDFYTATEKPSQFQTMQAKLSELSQAFSPAIDQVLQMKMDDKEIVYLFTYKYTSLFPIETFLLKDKESHLGDKFNFIRKLPIDQSYTVSCKNFGCQGNSFEVAMDNQNENYMFIGIGNTNPGFIISNPNLDEILDIEGLFSEKKLLAETTGLTGNLVSALEKNRNNIVHVAGEWKDLNNFPALVISNKTYAIELNNFQFMNNLPYLVFSKNKSSNFSESSYFHWEKVLSTFRYNKTRVIITSMASSSKEFRQALFYDMYYKIIHKKTSWNDAFFSAMERTKKGFPKSIWPYLMVIYEQ
jgi:hypothetical protein